MSTQYNSIPRTGEILNSSVSCDKEMDGAAEVPQYSGHVSSFLDELNQVITPKEIAKQDHARFLKSRQMAIKQKRKLEVKIKELVQDLEHQHEVISECERQLTEIEQLYPELAR